MPVAHPLLGERIARHGFADRPAASVADAIRLTTAVQSQDPLAGRLGVRSRSATVTDADVRYALATDRSVVKSSFMRATIHTVAAEDVRWLTALTGPAIARSFAKRWRDLGLTPPLLARTAAAIPTILADGPASRAEIVAGLAERRIVVDTTDPPPPATPSSAGGPPLASTHVMLHATTEGLVCRGPDRGRTATYALIDTWLPDAPDGPRGDDALAELARRYFAAFSPATPADFAVWSGLPSTRAIELIRDELTPVDVDGRAGYRLGEVEPARGLRLISAYDNYLVGYRERTFIADENRGKVYIGGVIRPTVLLDGRVVGRWQLSRRDGAVAVTVEEFESLSAVARRQLDAEVADVGRFLDVPATLAIS